MKRYEDLMVWQRAADLIERLGRDTGLRRSGDGLRGQIRRAVLSIASNIAEGNARASDVEFRHFLSIAHGSCAEVQAQLRVAYRGGCLDRGDFIALLDEAIRIGFMIANLMRRLAPP